MRGRVWQNEGRIGGNTDLAKTYSNWAKYRIHEFPDLNIFQSSLPLQRFLIQCPNSPIDVASKLSENHDRLFNLPRLFFSMNIHSLASLNESIRNLF